MDIFEGKNKRYCKRLTKFGRNIVLRIKPRAAMFVVRFANLSLARYLTNPRVIAWLPALKGPLEPRLITVLSLLKQRIHHERYNWLSIECHQLRNERGTRCKLKIRRLCFARSSEWYLWRRQHTSCTSLYLQQLEWQWQWCAIKQT